MSTNLTPREIVAELDKYIIGQNDAKRMVAIAVRNRWRRQQLDPSLRDEVAPKNMIMIGPTGVGKTEIARRLSKLCASPFIKVEATKYTEVGYVGRDVESMVRDLMEIGINLVREEENEKVREMATKKAEERLLDLLLPGYQPDKRAPTAGPGGAGHSAYPHVDYIAYQEGVAPTTTPADPIASDRTRDKFRSMWREGRLNDREVDIEIEQTSNAHLEILTVPGMEQMGSQFQDAFGKMFPSQKKRRKLKVQDAYKILLQEQTENLIDHDKVSELARRRVEETGIIFIDELDKVAIPAGSQRGADISREGVQRDLLPIVEGSTVNTKYGLVRTDHILFIAAGAFHFSKPSDLIPELQGRFPLRVELSPLGKDEFLRILTEPHNALTKQYAALLGTEGVNLSFTPDALEEISAFAEETNRETENIGARRLYTIMEKILAELSFEAPDKPEHTLAVDREYVQEQLADVRNNVDLSRYIL